MANMLLSPQEKPKTTFFLVCISHYINCMEAMNGKCVVVLKIKPQNNIIVWGKYHYINCLNELDIENLPGSSKSTLATLTNN